MEYGFLFTPESVLLVGESLGILFSSCICQTDTIWLERRLYSVHCTLSSLGGQKQAGAFLPDSLLFLDIVVDLVDKHAAHANQTLHCGSFLCR